MSSPARRYKHWYLFTSRGIFLLLLGVYAIFRSENPIYNFARIFEVFTLVSGLLLIQSALLNRHHINWQFVLFNGLLDFSFGIILWIMPEMSFLTLKIALAIWFLYSGLIQIVDSLILIHDNVKNWWFELISGGLSFIMAFTIIALRVLLQREVYNIVGVFAIIFGIFLVISSISLRDSES